MNENWPLVAIMRFQLFRPTIGTGSTSTRKSGGEHSQKTLQH